MSKTQVYSQDKMDKFEYWQYADGKRNIYPLRRADLILSTELRRRLDMELPDIRAFHGDHIHQACFIGFVALKTGVATVDEVLGDHGIIHSLCHAVIAIIGCEDYDMKLLEDIENRLANLPDHVLSEINKEM